MDPELAQLVQALIAKFFGGSTVGQVVQAAQPTAVDSSPFAVSPHYQAAQQALGLTPEEKFLYEMHLKNLASGGVPMHPGTATLQQMNTQIDGRYYNIPKVWDGALLEDDPAMARAEALGFDKFPSYATQQEAEDRYQAMHDYMNKDTGDTGIVEPGSK
jgi:hypothetical protein